MLLFSRRFAVCFENKLYRLYNNKITSCWLSTWRIIMPLTYYFVMESAYKTLSNWMQLFEIMLSSTSIRRFNFKWKIANFR